MFGYWKKRYLELNRNYIDLDAKARDLEIERDDLFNKLKSSQELLSRATEQNQLLEDELSSRVEKLNQAIRDMSKQCNSEIEELELENNQLRIDNDALGLRALDAEGKIHNLKEEIADLTNANQILKDTIGNQRKSIDTLARKICDIYAAFKVMQDVMNPTNEKDDFPLN